MMEDHFHRSFSLQGRGEVKAGSGTGRTKPHRANAGSRGRLRDRIETV